MIKNKITREKRMIDVVEWINSTEIQQVLSVSGWQRCETGYTKQINYDDKLILFKRKRRVNEVCNGEKNKISPKINCVDVDNTMDSGLGSISNMGEHKRKVTPDGDDIARISLFEKYKSLRNIRSDKESLVIAYDSEFFYLDDEMTERCMLSWQFAVMVKNYIYEFVFLPRCMDSSISLELALGRILDELSMVDEKIKSVDLRNVPVTAGKYDWSNINKKSVTLLCHAGKADLTALDQSKQSCCNFLKHCSEVQGGIVTLQPFLLYPSSLKKNKRNHCHKYCVSLKFADTMCHAPNGKKRLSDLGKTIHVEKVKLPDGMINQMDKLLMENPLLFMEYASNDSVVTLLYSAAIYGFNREIPITITSVSAKVMKDMMSKYLGYSKTLTTTEFNRIYRGLYSVSHGKKEYSHNEKAIFIDMSSLEAINRDAAIVQMDASNAYHGGYNSSSDIGYFDNVTFDYDLKNAYPTAMCLVPDIDWENPIEQKIKGEELTFEHFKENGRVNPFLPILCYVAFEFPDSVKYPSIPINVDGVLIFPKKSDGINGVYACGPELYIALCLGAKIFVKDGYVLRKLNKNQDISYALKYGVKQLVKDRNIAKSIDKDSLEQKVLKDMVNGCYGKVSQNVIEKHTWSAYSDEMVTIGCSCITNPVAACLITSIVRAELIAAQNQCCEMGYTTYSVTTDGFISDIPMEKLTGLDLYGLKPYLEAVRNYLTDDKNSEIWEIKHAQDDLLNFTTRGNVSLHCNDTAPGSIGPMNVGDNSYDGVCAHNSFTTGYISDSYEDRKALFVSVLSRTGPVKCVQKEWPKFSELVKNETTFKIRNKIRNIHMDFDMKRKPLQSSFMKLDVVFEGKQYEIVNFTTVPFDSVEEYLLYRGKKQLMDCLRTMDDWKKFWLKIIYPAQKVTDLEWSKLMTCVRGHRNGLWTIPALAHGSVEEKIKWINLYNQSKREFKISDWKNCRRPERMSSMLPEHCINDLLTRMIYDEPER